MSNVSELPVVTALDMPAERTLRTAMDARLTDAVVIGWDDEGDFYFSSSVADGASVNWLLDLAKQGLFGK